MNQVWTTLTLPGFHRWPDAPMHRDYLAQRHRHMFRITVWCDVRHDDRDTEFHDMQSPVRQWWGPGERECGNDSCETLARKLLDELTNYFASVSRVEVSEDGESGAVVWRPR